MQTGVGGTFTFTKLVVHDLEAMADYYCAVFGLHRGRRERFEKGVGGEPIDEISLVEQPGQAFGNLTLLHFVDRPGAPRDETILGFTTSDLTALLARVERAGGTLVRAIEEMPELGLRVAYVRDPEGHLNELVEWHA